MTKTKYDGVYYVVGADGKKNYKVRIWIDGKEYKRTIGKEPEWNAKLAAIEREHIEAELRSGGVVVVGTMDEMFSVYLDERGPKMGKYWRKNNFYQYKKHVHPHIGNIRADQVKRHSVQRIVDGMLKDGYKPKTAKDIRDMLRAFFRYYDLPNAADRIDLPKFDNAKEFSLSIDECRSVYRAIMSFPSPKWRCFFIHLLHGRRRGEVMSMRLEDFDFEQKTYTIRYGENKRRKTVAHPMTQLLENAVMELVRAERIIGGYLYRGRKDGTHVSIGAVENAWRKIKAEAGVEMRLHDLRHMIGHIGVGMGASLEQIGKVLDHTNIATTKRYSNVAMEMAGELIDDIIDALESSKR